MWRMFAILFLVLPGCELARNMAPGPVPEAAAPEPTGDSGLRPQARPGTVGVETTAPAVGAGNTLPAAALPPPAGVSGVLGTTIAALGDPGVDGLWLNTPLVRQERPGQVRYQGNVVAVTLRPLSGPAGAGSEISLRAMQALGAPLTELIEVTVEGT